jgi:hypothetical protein
VHHDFPTELQKPMEDLVDAFLYIGPQDLRLRDQMPTDIALDIDYRLELQRRGSLPGFPGPATGTLKEFDQQIVNGDENPLFFISKPRDPELPDPELKRMVQSNNLGGMNGLNLALTHQPGAQVRARSLDVLSHNTRSSGANLGLTVLGRKTGADRFVSARPPTPSHFSFSRFGNLLRSPSTFP